MKLLIDWKIWVIFIVVSIIQIPIVSWGEDYFPNQYFVEDAVFYNNERFYPELDLEDKFKRDFSIKNDWVRVKWKKVNMVETRCDIGKSSDFKLRLSVKDNFNPVTTLLFTVEW